MVACAALSSIQPPNHLAVPMTACAQTVEELKERLVLAVENDKEELCAKLLDEIRRAVTTREILENTRVGFHVNNVRKTHLKKWPQCSKKCRELIKHWQDFVADEKTRTHSGASSSSTTPNLISPSMAKLGRRGITPNTPLNRRVTSTGVQHGRLSALVSPANGSYAPRNQISPTGASAVLNGIHKSQSVGIDLLNHNRPMTPKEDVKNGKRKAVDELPLAAISSIKRTKTAIGSLVSPSTPQSVMDARKAVTSTSELVAQLSQSLPQHMSIDSSIREHEKKMKREHKDEEIAQQLQASLGATVERKKRKYERKQKPAPSTPSVFPSAPASEDVRGGLVVRFSKEKSGSVASTSAAGLSSKEESVKTAFEKIRSVPKATTPPRTVVEEDVDEVDAKYAPPPLPKIKSSKRKDWSSLIPSMAALRIKVEQNKKETEALVNEISSETKKDPTKVQKIKNFRRPILMLPYLDNPLGPDFLIHKYRNASQYYSEDNFLYGEERPSD